MGYAFISYSSRQRNEADSLRHLLHANNIDTWMAPHDIPDGSEYADVINSAIQNAACLVLLLTEDAQNSIYVDKEIERALHHGKTIAPIQLDRAGLNDSFSFYLCNQQIEQVTAIDASSPKMQRLIQHLQLLCNDRLPAADDFFDAARDKRVIRLKIARLFTGFGIALLWLSLFCGRRYVQMAARSTYMEMYGNVPELAEIARSYLTFFLMAFVAVFACLYGYGLRDPQKKTWNPIGVFPLRLALPAFSVLCGASFELLRLAQKAVTAIIRGLKIYLESTAGYLLPPWVVPTTRIFALTWLVTALIAFVLDWMHDEKNGFAFSRSLRGKFLMLLNHLKRRRK